jgi:hypothetical protein
MTTLSLNSRRPEVQLNFIVVGFGTFITKFRVTTTTNRLALLRCMNVSYAAGQERASGRIFFNTSCLIL